MRGALIVICLILFDTLQAQIVLTEDDMPDVGDTLLYSTSAISGFDGADTGPNHFWDYSGLTEIAQEADTVQSVISTPLLYQFFFNNPFLYPDNLADQSFRGDDLDFQAITVTDLYDYYASDVDAYRNVGFGANINGLPSSVQRIPADEIYAFPLEYGNSSSSFSSFEISIPTIAFIRQEQQRTNEVDGWGSLSLPSGTYDVIRVKSVLDRTDSVYVNALMFGFSLPEPQTVEYKWLALGENRPVLQVNTTGGFVTRVEFKQDSIANSVHTHDPGSEFQLFPNPAMEGINVITGVPRQRLFELRTVDGRFIESKQVSQQFSWDISDLLPGHYIIRSGHTVERFLKAR